MVNLASSAPRFADDTGLFVVEISNVTKQFQSLTAIDNVSLRISEGEVLGLLGPNGAGKTTLFRLVAGFLNPDAGRIRSTSSTWPEIGYKPERLLFPGNMRVHKYLELVAELSNLRRNDIAGTVAESLDIVNLAGAAGKRIKECSKGMRQRLGMAQSLIGDPPLLLLDEPSNGLDPEGQAEICQLIERLRDARKTVVLASHQLLEVTQVCTDLIILNRGSIHYQNRMEDALAERPHTTIHVEDDISQLKPLLESLHPNITAHDNKVILNNEAIEMRRQVLSILLAGGYDISEIEQSRVSLAEIYAEAVQ